MRKKVTLGLSGLAHTFTVLMPPTHQISLLLGTGQEGKSRDILGDFAMMKEGALVGGGS